MRLTLRTLLAWLDDTLPPVQVREIGKQVGSSPLAQELVQRIHRVTRQRRLTVPSKSGPDATDPNLVASYLDNDLNAEQVAEYEKKCLTSDVNLAEAASVHQILSLLGQRVQVPLEAKARMYTLVKGRESHPIHHPAEAAAATPDPRNQPIVPWVVQTPPSRHWLEQFGPLAACLGLVGVLSWAAYESLKPDAPGDALTSQTVPARAGGVPGAGRSSPKAQPPVVAAAEPPPVAPVLPANVMEDDEPEPAPEPPAEPKPAEVAPKPVAVEVPAGAAGAVGRVEGMLLRYDGDKREWVAIKQGDVIRSGDRVMSPPSSFCRLGSTGGAFVVLEDSEVKLSDPAADGGANLELVRGRIVAEPSSSARPLHLTFQGQTLDLDLPADLAVGFESTGRWSYGAVDPAGPPLIVHIGPGGEVSLKGIKAKETVKGPATVRVTPAGVIEPVKDAPTPEWLASPPSSAELTALREKYLKEFATDRPVLADVVAATESTDVDVKKMAIAALRGLGDLSLLTPVLDRRDDPAGRQAAIAAIREELASGEAAARRAWDQLQLDFGDTNRTRLAKLLAGYSAEDAARPETMEQLVDSLSPREESLAVRELAIDNLKRLTHRDTPAYDADHPEQGYAAWRKLLDDGQLKPAAGK
ncbi:hypothetical protein [Paludisphaera rhizosphaerae]|uniref:hypothetical protein n=1 Tax=Paludisphaera rhizosphaerae TaxID=2711216 RepID=UPI0013EAFB3E|nr:hypothetical protein [Paludisphaera rhizosphaerae]